MEKSTPNKTRGFLKGAERAGLCALLAVTGIVAGSSALSGCATAKYANMPEDARIEYRHINPYKLTAEQEKYLSEFNNYIKKNNGLSDEEKDMIKGKNPFINPDNLTIKDKIFLIIDINKSIRNLNF